MLSTINQFKNDETEVVVVDDGSTDNSGKIAENHYARVIRSESRQGPAKARNLGASLTKSEILCFLDSDCLIKSDTLKKLIRFLEENQEVDAIFGTYDDNPPTKNWIGRYKNLYLHHTYQIADSDTRIFSTACGCVRRNAYDAIGGFSEPYLKFPGMQDVEFGYRLSEAGFLIKILKDVQVTHLKDWGLSVWKSDIVNRGIPWIKIILSKPSRIEQERNMSKAQRVCLVLTWMATALSIVMLPHILNSQYTSVSILVLIALLAIHAVIALMNSELLRLMNRRFGFIFAIFAYIMHYIYYLNCGVAITIGTMVYFIEKSKGEKKTF